MLLSKRKEKEKKLQEEPSFDVRPRIHKKRKESSGETP